MERDDFARASDCPTPDVILAYALGKLPLEQVEVVGRHISGCPRCESSLRVIPDTDDSFVSKLRAYVAEESSAQPAELTASTRVLGSEGEANAARNRFEIRQLPARFGGYVLLEKLGEGGMAIVFKARQLRPDRLVAIKIPLCVPVPGTDGFDRFRRESETIARLEHPHIVRLYECGEHHGVPYFSMEYMEGGSLARTTSGAPLPAREALALVETMARAAHFAHQPGATAQLKVGHRSLSADDCSEMSGEGRHTALLGWRTWR